MIFDVLALVFSALGLACAALVLIHAFRRSIGTGFMVLCIPCYILYYAFSQFEHVRKSLIIAGLVGGLTLAGAMRAMSTERPVLTLPAR